MTKQPTSTLWPVVFAAIAAGIVVATHLGKVAPALPAIRASLSGDLITSGWIASVVSLVGALGGVALGTIANNANVRVMAIGALVLLSLASAGGAMAATSAQLIVARSFEGLAIVSMAVTAPAIIARTTSVADRPFGLALWSTYVPTGMTVGILLAVLVLELSSWRALWVVTSAMSLLSALLFAQLTRGVDLRSPRVGVEVKDVIASVTSKGPWLLSACFACYAFMWVSLITWMPTFLSSELGLSLSGAALATAVMTGINVAGNFAGAFWLRRGFSRLLLIGVAMTCMAIFGGLSMAATTPADFRIFVGISFSLISGVVPAALIGATSAMARRPGEVASANGVVVQGSQLGQLVGPPTAGALAQSSGSFAATAIVFPIASIIGLGFAFAIAKMELSRLRSNLQVDST